MSLMNPIISNNDDKNKINEEEQEIDLYSIYYKQNTTKSPKTKYNNGENKIIFFIKKYFLCCFYKNK